MADPHQKPSAGASMATAARYMGMAFMIPMGAGAGWVVGTFLDSKLKTNYWMMICLFLGIVGGFIQMALEVMRDAKKKQP